MIRTTSDLAAELSQAELPVYVAGPGGVYVVIDVYEWAGAFWFEIEKDHGWKPPKDPAPKRKVGRTR